jgi:cyclopropane-fatty-acyl-phospholipid synthase
MFEHLRNYDTLLARVASWMARHFIIGGIVPAKIFCSASGATCGFSSIGRCPAGTASSPRHRAEIMPVLARTYGGPEALLWWVYWRVSFMACAELWGYADGREWLVSHYLFEKR